MRVFIVRSQAVAQHGKVNTVSPHLGRNDHAHMCIGVAKQHGSPPVSVTNSGIDVLHRYHALVNQQRTRSGRLLPVTNKDDVSTLDDLLDFVEFRCSTIDTGVSTVSRPSVRNFEWNNNLRCDFAAPRGERSSWVAAGGRPRCFPGWSGIMLTTASDDRAIRDALSDVDIHLARGATNGSAWWGTMVLFSDDWPIFSTVYCLSQPSPSAPA